MQNSQLYLVSEKLTASPSKHGNSIRKDSLVSTCHNVPYMRTGPEKYAQNGVYYLLGTTFLHVFQALQLVPSTALSFQIYGNQLTSQHHLKFIDTAKNKKEANLI